MAGDFLPILARFHREVLLPDVQRVVGEAVEASERRLRDEMHALFDAQARRLEKARVDNLQEQVRTLEARLDE